MGLYEGQNLDPATRRRLYVDLAIFFVAAFALTWLISLPYILDEQAATEVFGPMELGAPMFFAAVYVPSVAGLVISGMRYGLPGLRDLIKSALRIRANIFWIAICLFGYPALWLVVALVQAAVGGGLGSFDFSPWFVAFPAVLLAGHILTDPGALGEELGWRGFALPRLMELLDARSASLILGVVWAVWHLPAFSISTLSQSGINFGLFVINVTAFSVIMTWLFVHVRGSVLLAGIVPHMLINSVPKAGIAPVFIITVLLAVAILVFGGKTLRGIGRPKVELPQSALLQGAGAQTEHSRL